MQTAKRRQFDFMKEGEETSCNRRVCCGACSGCGSGRDGVSDEVGRPTPISARSKLCQRAKLLVDTVGFRDIIFDPNVLRSPPGLEEHNNYSVDFIEGRCAGFAESAGA